MAKTLPVYVLDSFALLAYFQAEPGGQTVRALPITLSPVTEDRIFAAARLKAEHSMSYADAFAAALAQELGAALVTGDPEFKSVEPTLRVMWLPNK